MDQEVVTVPSGRRSIAGRGSRDVVDDPRSSVDGAQEITPAGRPTRRRDRSHRAMLRRREERVEDHGDLPSRAASASLSDSFGDDRTARVPRRCCRHGGLRGIDLSQ